MAAPSPSGPDSLQAALCAVARAIADSLELKDVWDRVAEACRTVVPFDGMGVSRLQPDGRVRALAATGVPAAATLVDRFFDRRAFSPRLWPDADDYLVLIHDAPRELDPAFGVDRDVLARGYRSAMRLPLGRGQGRAGSLILTSTTPGRFTEAHGRALEVVADMVALALAHEKLAARRRERRRRRDALERLIPTLTGTLDVRAVFDQVAQIAQQIIPHDYLTLGLLTDDRRRVRIHAKWGDDGLDLDDIPEFPLQPSLLHTVNWDYSLAREYEPLGGNRVRMHLVNRPPLPVSVHDLELDDFWTLVYTELGVRSSLRATVRLKGEAIGGLEFSARQADAFDDEDGEFAMRIAEHVALALAHQKLAEESRRAAHAQDRATRLEERVQALVEELEQLTRHRALGRSRKWRDVLAQATKVAQADTTVLITGESGTGKEVLARFIHRGSARKDGPFVALNCAALPDTLLEAELFGHEKGAFTGAMASRPGRLEQAAGGVLFLDEVGEMSPAVQAKLLRVLQEREYQRVGGTRTLKADIRVLAATNRDLEAGIARGTFREDLYYRLAVFEIPLPPLRERPEDVLVLADAFLEEIGATIGRPAAGVSAEARERLVAHAWPGNVRELHNALERAVILCEGGLISSEHLPFGVASAVKPTTPAAAPAAPQAKATATLQETEREMIRDALARAGQNKSKAARLLGLTRAQLRSRIDKHGLES
ncbi:MAG TPA: sigma 54-interacting transcriptional regulator [Vicinamibacteria bacterium]